jgi:hypothetical protein
MEPEDRLDLGPFVAATRRELDRVAHRKRLSGIPPAPPVPRRELRLGVLVAAAAVLIGAAVLAATGSDALSSMLRSTSSEAEHQVEPRGPALASPRASAPGRPVFEARDAAEAAAKPAPPPESIDAHAAAPIDEAAPVEATPDPAAPPPEHTVTSPRVPSRSSLLAELQRLDAEAQRRWQAGDLTGAEALFLEIVEKGGRTRYAELAFGDLFTLASQAGDPGREQQRWRRYLARFPHGRFADDVRAWQCRRTEGDEAVACWQRYLDDWPRGTYRAEAGRVAALGRPR